MPEPQPIRVLLVDDDPLVRSGLRFLLDSTDDVEVIGEADDGAAALAFAREHRLDVVVMDLRMDGVDGVVATAEIRALASPPEVLVLTTWDLDEAVVRSIEAGASGFLLKTAKPADIITAVRAVAAGDAVMSPRSTRHLLDHLADGADMSRRREAADRIGQLTERERDVALGVARGLTNSEIAGELFVSEGTVKTHLASMLAKLDSTSRVQVAVLMERAGLLA